ncbi:MAG: cold-shock protein [Anaerolineae bacterium]
MENSDRTLGTVQWFSRVKGYGFIRPDGQEEDVFVHYSSIRGNGYRNLDQGQRVEFTIEDTPKGPQAVDVAELGKEETEVAAGIVELDTDETEATEAFL